MSEEAAAVGAAGGAADSGAAQDQGKDASTPTSSTKFSASKDKKCQYCGQAFTSSSLGRHLDLYVKESNPKPPDGIHDVDEIRRLRGRITRRQARTSSGRRESSTPSIASRNALHSRAQSPSNPIPNASLSGSVRRKPVPNVHSAGWEATGVILDLPPAASEITPRLESRRSSSKHTQLKAKAEHTQREREAGDKARAAELALREVLGMVKAATTRAKPPSSPFDFDPFTLTFPALVLRCLPLPPTLFAHQPFSTLTSCSLDPPTQPQFDTVVKYIRERYQQWKSSALATFRKEFASNHERELNGLNDCATDLGKGKKSQQQHRQHLQQQQHQDEQRVQQRWVEDEARTLRHITDAFSHWKTLPDKQRQEAWRLETLRALSREQSRREEVAQECESVKEELENLRAQFDSLSRCQFPREFLFQPLRTAPLPKDTAQEMYNTKPSDPREWEFDALISKWTNVIQSNRREIPGMPGQKPLNSPSTLSDKNPPTGLSPRISTPQQNNTTSRSPLTSQSNQRKPMSGGMFHSITRPPEDEDEDDLMNGFDAEGDVEAEGEDDEDLADAPAEHDDHVEHVQQSHSKAPLNQGPHRTPVVPGMVDTNDGEDAPMDMDHYENGLI